MTTRKEIAQRVKEYVINTPFCLCNSPWCPNLDGYCPKYSCGFLDRIKSYSDRQWENAVRDAVTRNGKYLYEEGLERLELNKPAEQWDMDDIAIRVLEVLIDREPSRWR